MSQSRLGVLLVKIENERCRFGARMANLRRPTPPRWSSCSNCRTVRNRFSAQKTAGARRVEAVPDICSQCVELLKQYLRSKLLRLQRKSRIHSQMFLKHKLVFACVIWTLPRLSVFRRTFLFSARSCSTPRPRGTCCHS